MMVALFRHAAPSRPARWVIAAAISYSMLHSCNAAFDLGYGDDQDLSRFVTRPDLKAPIFNVTIYHPDEVDAGYWFVGPYAEIIQKDHAANYYQACQTGPAIYDGNGDLVWSGACLFRNQNACDFRAYNFNNSFQLSAIVNFNRHTNDMTGRGAILSAGYKFSKTVEAPATSDAFNMHELKLINDGKAALYIANRPTYADLRELGEGYRTGWISNPGFEEVDLTTDKVTFSWHAHPQVSLLDSTRHVPEDIEHSPWNWFHPNSVEKNAEGDYLFSSRYTDCIYKISGRDGKILWRLGGRSSSFELQGFNFSRQHDALWLDYNDDFETISFLDNGGDDQKQTSNVTSGLYVKLDKRKMTASVIQRWNRPGDRYSGARGNFQTLPSGHVFGGWSEHSHISEHTKDGKLLMEAEWASERFVTYRSYKFNFTGAPEDPPDFKAFAYGLDAETATTVYYASWNGATEVSSWHFYQERENQDPILLGTAKRTGFETRFQSRGFVNLQAYVEAVDRHGEVLGRSLPSRITSYVDQEQTQPSADGREDPEVETLEKTEL